MFFPERPRPVSRNQSRRDNLFIIMTIFISLYPRLSYVIPPEFLTDDKKQSLLAFRQNQKWGPDGRMSNSRRDSAAGGPAFRLPESADKFLPDLAPARFTHHLRGDWSESDLAKFLPYDSPCHARQCPNLEAKFRLFIRPRARPPTRSLGQDPFRPEYSGRPIAPLPLLPDRDAVRGSLRRGARCGGQAGADRTGCSARTDKSRWANGKHSTKPVPPRRAQGRSRWSAPAPRPDLATRLTAAPHGHDVTILEAAGKSCPASNRVRHLAAYKRHRRFSRRPRATTHSIWPAIADRQRKVFGPRFPISPI